jgi:hypothetical protein
LYTVLTPESFCQLVDPRIEPFVKGSWVKKINRSGGEDPRFLAATHSALYCCRNSGIMRSLKIAHTYAWVDCVAFEMPSATEFVFAFGEERLSFTCQQAATFLSPVLSCLRVLLPPLPAYAKIQAPAGMQLVSTFPHPMQFIHLFISACRSMGITPDESFITNVRRALQDHEPLEILQISFASDSLRAICWALCLTRAIPSLSIGGFIFPDLFASIAQVLRSNPTVTTLRIVNYSRQSSYLMFLKSVAASNLKSLTFVSVTFQRTMIAALTDRLVSSPNLLHIGFVSCGFDLYVFGALLEAPEHLTAIQSLEISKDQTKIAQCSIPAIVNFMSLAQLTSITLREMSIDIAVFLSTLENADLTIAELNLAGNYCSRSYKRGLLLPATLVELDLSDVRWGESTLFYFLSWQPFPTPVALKLSNASFRSGREIDPFAALATATPPVQIVSLLTWDGNILTPSFLRQLEHFARIEKLSLEVCRVPAELRDDVEAALVHAIANLRLKKLSVRGTLQSLNPNAMSRLRQVLITHRTLCQLNIADNGIGVAGLRDVIEIVAAQNKITHVWCDGSRPDDPNAMLQVLNEFVRCESLRFVAKPRSDFARLFELAPTMTQNIKIAWRALTRALSRRSVTEEPEALLVYDDRNASQPVLDVGFPLTAIEASWEMSIELGYGGDIIEWQELRDKFTIETILDVPRLDDSINLIDFTA